MVGCGSATSTARWFTPCEPQIIGTVRVRHKGVFEHPERSPPVAVAVGEIPLLCVELRRPHGPQSSSAVALVLANGELASPSSTEGSSFQTRRSGTGRRR